jgi:hypothetical protein
MLTIVGALTFTRIIASAMTDDSCCGHSLKFAVNSFDSQPDPRRPAFEIEGSFEFEYTE